MHTTAPQGRARKQGKRMGTKRLTQAPGQDRTSRVARCEVHTSARSPTVRTRHDTTRHAANEGPAEAGTLLGSLLNMRNMHRGPHSSGKPPRKINIQLSWRCMAHCGSGRHLSTAGLGQTS